MDNVFKDWLFRYGFVLRKRRTKKEKQRFIQSLVSDIIQERDDIKVIAYDDENYHSRNIYVGDIENASTIVCTYYDTPLIHTDSYILFDRKDQREKTTIALLVTTCVLLLVGFVGTFIYMNVVEEPFNLKSISTYIVILAYIVYFYILGRTSKGLSNRNTLIRNTSSILAMLKMITEVKDPSIAYAFVDEGSFGDEGRRVLEKQARKDSVIYYLDSIGAQKKLNLKRENNVIYLFSANKVENQYILEQNDLKQKELSMNNIEHVIEIIKKQEVKLC